MAFAGLKQPGQIGIREELADYIAVVDAKSTPFTSMIPKGKDIGNMTFSWQVDNYSAVVMGGMVEGTDIVMQDATNPVSARARFYNYAQVFKRDLRIGFIAETSDVAGLPGTELANGIAKRMVEIKRDCEATFCCTNQLNVIDNATNAYLTASLGTWLTLTGAAGQVGLPTTAFAPASGAVTTTVSASITETTIQAVLTAIYGATGRIRDYDAIVGTTLKRAFTNLTVGALTNSNTTNGVAATSVRTFNMDIDSTYTSSIDIFEGDFGRLILHPTTFIGGTTGTALNAEAFKGYVIPMELCEMRYAKLPDVTTLPDAGGGPARLVRMIAGLVVKNPLGFGMFNGAS